MLEMETCSPIQHKDIEPIENNNMSSEMMSMKAVAMPTASAKGRLYDLEKRFKYRIPGQHYYFDVMWNSLVPEERLRNLDNFNVKSDDIIVTGYPKSGTTWLEEIIYLIQNDADITKSNQMPVYVRVPYLEGKYDGMMLNSMTSPRIYKTHLPYRVLPKDCTEKQPKFIYIIRNPRDIAVSYYHFYRALAELGNYDGTWEEYLKMFMAGYVCCGDWFEHVKGWSSHVNDSNLLIVTYENLKKHQRKETLRIAKFLGKSLNQDALDRIIGHTNFESMKNNPMLNFKDVPNIDQTISPFMRKGQVGDWMNYFTSSQIKEFDELISEKFGEDEELKKFT